MDIIDPDSDKEIEKLFGDHMWGRKTWKSKFLRVLWHPLWYVSSKEYRQYRFYNLSPEKRKIIVKRIADGIRRGEQYSNLPLIDKVVGRDKEISVFLNAIYYHVLRDPIALKQKKAPPKVFLVKGEPGSGKSWLIQAAAREAFDRAAESGFLLSYIQLEAAAIIGEFMGQMTRGAAGVFDRASKVPTFLYIDEAQSLFQKGSSSHGDSAAREYQAAESAMLQALDRIIKRPVRTIVVMSSNVSERIREDIRRRCYLMDLDTPGLKRDDMVKIVGKFLEKLQLKDLNPEEVFSTLEQGLRGIGEGRVVPHDIDRMFDEMVTESEKPLQEAFLKRLEGVEIEPLPITLDNIKKAAPKVRSYKERDVTQAVKEAEQTIPPKTRYVDVGGLKDIKNPVIKEVTLSLHPEKAGSKWKPPRAYLFWGVPGSGKTLLASAIAGENKVPFFYVKGPSLFAGIVGESERGVRDLFAKARAKAPSIIFMDELDAIGRARGGPNLDSGVHLGAITTLLSELDGLTPKEGVVFIGSTNRKDQLDNALIDRMDKQFEFTFPKTSEEKLDIIKAQWREYQSESQVTVDQIYRLFLKKTFSPRKSADTIAESVRMAQLESIGCKLTLEAMGVPDSETLNSEEQFKLRQIYHEDFQRIQDRLTKPDILPDGTKEAPEFDLVAEYGRIADNNPIVFDHLEKAFEKVVNTEEDKLERAVAEMHRSREPKVGKGYGLAMDETGTKGVFLTLECLIFKAVEPGKGAINVFGNVGRGAEESARIARDLLRIYCPKLVDLDIELHVISSAEGGETVAISGPSAGQAMLHTILSALILEPFNPEVCMTGKVDFHGIAGMVGGIQPSKGTGKLDAARENGFKYVLIPLYAYEKLVSEFQDYLQNSVDSGTTIVGGFDWRAYAKFVFPNLEWEQIVEKLKSA